MAFQTPCMNCRKIQTPVIDIGTGNVYCTECDMEIPNISHFFKVQMKTLGQTRKANKSAYAIRCNACKKEAFPKLSNNELICQFCNVKYTNISKPFEMLIRDKIKNGSNDI